MGLPVRLVGRPRGAVLVPREAPQPRLRAARVRLERPRRPDRRRPRAPGRGLRRTHR